MKYLVLIFVALIVMSIKINAQENQNKNNLAPRLCNVTLKDDNIFTIKNYSLQTLSDKVSHQGNQVIKYTDKSRSNIKFKHDYLWILVRSGLYQKVKFADIEKLTLIHKANERSKCEIKINSDSTIIGSYLPAGIKLDCVGYSFLVTKENSEELKLESKWVHKIEKNRNLSELWDITYKQIRKYVNEPDYDTIIVSAINIEWITNKSSIVSSLQEYGETEKIKFLEVDNIESNQNPTQVRRINFADISSIKFYTGGKREVILLDGTILNCEFKKLIKYLFGDIDDNLKIYTPLIWGSVKAMEFIN